MKIIILTLLLFLALSGCASIEPICSNNSEHEYCNLSIYDDVTKDMLEQYEGLENKKAFAFAKSGKWQFVGIGYDYDRNSSAIKQAFSVCQAEAKRVDIEANCELLKLN